MNHSLYRCAFLSLAFGFTAAFAQTDGPRQPGGPGGGFGGMGGAERKLVAQFDKDGDKRLNAEERKEAREFLKKNPGGGRGPGGGGRGPGGAGPGGGRLAPSLAAPLLAALDGDKDGGMSEAEWKAGLKQFFTAADEEKKESIDATQLGEALNVIIPPPPGAAQGGPGGPGGPGQGGAGARRFGLGTMVAPVMVTRADANKDGRMTLEELTTAGLAMFKEQDKDQSGKLEAGEIDAALIALMPAGPGGPGGGGRGGFGGPGGGAGRDPARPGPQLSPADVKSYPDATLYEPTVLRTIFIEFENKTDWEAELAEFNNTDVDIPATITVDGRVYPTVGIHFRGMSSFGMVPAGYKRSLNLSMDFVDGKQRLYGFKTLNLLNAAGDASMLSSILYSHIASEQKLPAPRANMVKVVINGESWGLYTNVQQFNKEFLTDHFKTDGGVRWKVPGSPNGQGGLEYLGDNIDEYKRRYEIKSKDDEKSWKALIELCRVLNKTPAEELEAAIAPMLDIDGALKFLALDVALINSDGYWTRASDYNIYLDPQGRFHIIPHDMNESFRAAGGGPGGGRGGPGGPGRGDGGGGTTATTTRYELDPLVGLTDARKPLCSKLLAVPSLRARYLAYVRAIAQDSLDWQRLGPVVAQYRELMEKEVAMETRKLITLDAFRRATDDAANVAGGLRDFADGRRAYLLNYVERK